MTGGAGYIGSHTVRALRTAGRSVVVLDTLELGHADAVIDAPLVVGEIADEALVEGVCREHGVDTIVHFAAYKNVGESMREPSKYFRNNVDGTVRLLDAARRAGVDQVVFSSSCSVYGTPDSVPVDESQAIRPESVYAETKAIVERVLHWYGELHGLCSVSLRYFNAAGASLDGRLGEDWTYALNLIPVAIRALLVGDRRLQVYGDDYPTPDGTCVRDYIHIIDLARAHILAMGPGRRGFFNLGNGEGYSVREVIQMCERVTGQSIKAIEQLRRHGDPPKLVASAEKARKELGWKPEYPMLEDIVASAWRWHQQHPSGYPD